MDEKSNVWFGFIGSFNPKFYKEVSRQPFGRSFGYLMLFLLVMSLVLSVKYTFYMRVGVEKAVEWLSTDFAKKLPEVLPVINIKDGEVSSPVRQPFVYEGEGFAFDVPPLLPMLSEYYDLRGWTEEGRPDKDTINRLGLDEFAT